MIIPGGNLMLTIDRFEGDFAICQTKTGQIQTIQREKLPKGCHEGDAIELKNGVYVQTDNSLRRKEMKEKMEKLFKKPTSPIP